MTETSENLTMKSSLHCEVRDSVTDKYLNIGSHFKLAWVFLTIDFLVSSRFPLPSNRMVYSVLLNKM